MIQEINLTQRQPRSPRVMLGGFVILPRMLDKCRATLNGTNGEYHYACPLDQRLIQFLQFDEEALKAHLATGASDSEALEWLKSNASAYPTAWEIAAWSDYNLKIAPGDNGTRDFFNGLIAEAKGADRPDIVTSFDMLDLDDYVTFGGQP